MTSLVERLRALDYNVDIAMHWDDADVITEAADTIEALCEALRPFALAARKGSNVYTGVQMAMKDRPDLFSYSTAYIDAGRSTANSHLSWSDYLEALAAFEKVQS
jgi:hypothetical protein